MKKSGGTANDGVKKGGGASNPKGLRGALKVYKVLYETDKHVILLLFPIAALNALTPYITLFATAYILEGFISGRSYENLLYIALFAAALNFAAGVASKFLAKIQKTRNDVFIPKIYMQYAKKYLSIDYELLESPAINDVNARVARDNQWGSGFYNLSHYLNTLLDNLFGFIAGAILIIPFFTGDQSPAGAPPASRSMLNNGGPALVSFAFIAAMLAFAAAAAFINAKFIQSKQTAHLRSNDKKYETKYNFYFVYGSPISSLLKTARIYDVKKLLSRYLEIDSRRLDAFCKVFTKYSCESGLVRALTSGAITVGAYLFVVARAAAGAVTAGNVVRYSGTIYNLANSFFGLSSAIATLVDQTDRIQSMLEFMEVKNVLYKGTLPVEKRDDNQYEIEFRNVSFKYPGADRYSLRNFSIRLNIGQKLAVVGMNGSGKTTMIKLLCRLYDPSEGVITLNGIDIKKYDYAEYISIFSVVFQDFKLFSFKLSENITCSASEERPYGDAGAMGGGLRSNGDMPLVKAGTADENVTLAKAIDMVGLSGRVGEMGNGVGSYLYNDFDDGVEISGGEAQKIALARALYKNAPFVVLDEPTAALDPITEYEIYSKFNEIAGDKTTVFISHRLSSCRFCDDIAVFHEGSLIQRGNHNALLADAGGKYHELWNAQAQYYE